MKKTMLALVVSVSVLSGCKTTEINPVAVEDGFQQVQGLDVTYIVPSEYVNPNHGVNGLEFGHFHRGTKTTQEKLGVSPITPMSFSVHRQTDIGSAESGIIYNVSHSASVKDNNTIIKLHPFQTKSYQQGVTGHFTTPTLDVQEYLLTSKLNVQFEIDSNYSSDVVLANFERTLPKKQLSLADLKNKDTDSISLNIMQAEDRYVLDVDGNDIWFSVESYPHNEGTKVVITADLNTNPNHVTGTTVNLAEMIEKMKASVSDIVAS